MKNISILKAYSDDFLVNQYKHLRKDEISQYNMMLCNYCQISNIRCTLVGNKIVDSDVVGASPFLKFWLGAAYIRDFTVYVLLCCMDDEVNIQMCYCSICQFLYHSSFPFMKWTSKHYYMRRANRPWCARQGQYQLKDDVSPVMTHCGMVICNTIAS